MALGRRIFTQTEFIAHEDDAIDHQKSDYAAYIETLDPKKLAFVEGREPTRFTIRPLTYEQRQHSETIDAAPSRIEFLVRCGLVGVKNYLVMSPDGGETELTQPQMAREGRFGEIVTRAWLAEANLPWSQQLALATAIGGISDAKRPLS
jgi:hypothetical protein